MTKEETAPEEQPSIRGSVELPPVVLGSQELPREAPRERVLPGRVNVRWLAYPAYIACFLAGGIAIHFAVRSDEWSPVPVALAWGMLYFWEWIYAIAYSYRRPILKYSSLTMLSGLALLLAWMCLDRGAAGYAIAHGQLIERGALVSLRVAAIFTLISGASIVAHALALGRGYRRINSRAKISD